MKTTIKSIRMEKFEGQFTGKLIIGIADEVTGFVRDVDDEGVITFKQAQVPYIKMALSAFSAQCRQTINDKFAIAFGHRIDAAKVNGVDEMVNVLNVILSGAIIDIDSELQKAKEDDDASHDAIFYKITSLKLNEMMSYLVAQYFVEKFMNVTDITRQQAFISKLFAVEL